MVNCEYCEDCGGPIPIQLDGPSRHPSPARCIEYLKGELRNAAETLKAARRMVATWDDREEAQPLRSALQKRLGAS
jgi:hypothetical protein